MVEYSPYDLPEGVLKAFADCTLLSLARTAALLNMDRATLRRMLNRGDITARQKGVGSKKLRFVFTIADVAKYLRSTHTVETCRYDLLDHLRSRLTHRTSGPRVNVTLVRRKRKKPKVKRRVPAPGVGMEEA